MKPTLLLGCALLAGTALHAQVSFLPYVGIEQSRTTTAYANALSAQAINGFLKAGFRTDYRLKGGHSPFINLTTSPALTSFAFDKAGTFLNQYQSGGLQFRFEAGYQYSSKPIRLGKQRTPQPSVGETTQQTTVYKSRCGSMVYRSSCGTNKRSVASTPPSKNLNMRLQPSVALAYIPSATQSVTQRANGFDYTPSWKTAIVPAMGFEFAKGSQRLFTLGVFYTSPVGQSEEVVSTVVESKTITNNLQPRTATWGLTMGVPFSFAKQKGVKTNTERKSGCTKSYFRRSMRI